MAAPTLQFKRGNAGVAGTVPALRPGEPAISLNNFDFFIGIDTSVANNKFFGSHRYWGREDGTNSLSLKLVDKDGSNGIHIKSPNTVSGIGTYTIPDTNTIVDGYFLKVSSNGTLSWDTVGGENGTFANPTLTGITTITDTLNVSADSNFTGITTISDVDINGGTIDGVVIGGDTPDEGYFTLVDTDVLVSDNSTIGVATATNFYINTTEVLYEDGGLITLAGIQTIDATTKNTLETILSLDPNDFDSLNVAGIATVGGIIDAKGGLDVTGHTELDNLNVSGVSTFAGTLNSTTQIVANNLSSSGVSTLTTLEVTGNSTIGDASTDTLTVNATSTFNSPATFLSTLTGTISTATRATSVDTTTATTNTYYPGLFLNNTGTNSATVYVDAGISYVSDTDTLTLSGDLAVNGGDVTTSATTATVFNTNATTVNAFGDGTTVQLSALTGTTTIRNNLTVGGDITVGGSDIKAADGTTALTLANVTGAVTAAQDLTVQGNLYVNGSTTQVNTTSLTVEDRTLDLGKISGSVPASATTWDLGVLFNYNSDGAKKSAVIWEHNDSRFKFASVLGADTNGTDLNTPQLTVTTFAPIEVAELWVNNTCSSGAQQVIGCVGSELQLQNIVVDGGIF
jgi:hypothetical protein